MSSLSVIDQIRSQPGVRQRLAALSDAELSALAYDWMAWRRPDQVPPEGDWATWLILAGRGYGKTRVGAEQVRQWVKDGYRQINIVAATADDLRDTCVEGESGIMAVCPASERPTYQISKRRLVWPNGAITLLFSADEPERLRGKQHSKLWCDELASWRYQRDAWDQALFGLRLGTKPQAIITTTPRPTKLIRELLADPHTAVTRGTTYANRSNLAPTFYSQIIKKYENTRLGRQELNAEVLDDNPGALWKLSDIDDGRVVKLPPLSRIVVALDPAVTSSEDSDEWGIIACGQDGRDPAHYYVIADESSIYTPDEAAKQAVRLYHRLGADRIIGEGNNGGDMIEALLRGQDANVAYRKVTASRGKAIRAEPVSALYEQGRVHHHGSFPKLEDELVQWSPQAGTSSPNRLDALVWALTEMASGNDGWAGYVRGEAKEMEEKGIVQAKPVPRINVAGENRDRCSCGSSVWVDNPGGHVCWKCGILRPK